MHGLTYLNLYTSRYLPAACTETYTNGLNNTGILQINEKSDTHLPMRIDYFIAEKIQVVPEKDVNKPSRQRLTFPAKMGSLNTFFYSFYKIKDGGDYWDYAIQN